MCKMMLYTAIALVLCGTNSFAKAATPSSSEWVDRSNENAQILLTVMAKFSPEGAGQLGVEGLDEEIADLKPGITERSNKAVSEAIDELNARLGKEKDASVRQDLEILIKTAQDNIRGNGLTQKYQIPYFNISRLVFSGVRGLLDDQVPESRRNAAVVRLRKYAGLVDGYAPISQLAIDRTRERMEVAGLIGPVKDEVEKDLAQNQFFVDGIGKLFEKYKLKGYEEAYTALKVQLKIYDDFVRSEILPKALEDFRLPPELYAFSVEQVGVDIPPTELAAMAYDAFTDLQKQMQTIASQIAKQKGLSSSDYRAVIRELKKDQLVGDAILSIYKEKNSEIEEIIRREHIVTLPAREMRIRIASEAESAQTPAPNMRPPRMIGDTGEMGEFVLPLNIPSAEGEMKKFDDFTFAAASWTLSAHEGRPGHEMQFASVIEKGVSITRAIFAFNSVNVEGWGLYSEAIILPHMPIEGQLISLQHRLLRAGRAFMDPELQMGKMKREEALRLLKEDIVISDAMANQEVERYTFRSPGQATAYFYGYTKLMDLRKAMEKSLGKSFDQ